MNKALAEFSTEALEAELIRRYRQLSMDDKSVRSSRVTEHLTTAIAQRRAGEALRPGWRARLNAELRGQ